MGGQLTKAPSMPVLAPNRAAALAQYRRRAGVYDFELAALEPIRREAVELLGLGRGDTVFDVGCGTGLSLPLLRAAVGPRGRVIGIEQSPEMIERAGERVRSGRWRNVALLNVPVEEADLQRRANAALFHFTHDILRRPDALERIVVHLEPGARIVASGLKWSDLAISPVNLGVLVAARRSVSTFEGLRRPWDRIEALIGPMTVRRRMFGGVYIAVGRKSRP